MFKNFTIINLSDDIFLKRHLNVDTSFINGFRFCVGSGTKRDLTNGEVLKKIKSLKDYLELKKYPPESEKLRFLIDKVARSFVISNDKDFSKLLETINSEIMDYNSAQISGKTDYLSKDYFGMSVSGGEIKDDRLIAFNIGDSNILVLDKFYDVLYKTKDDVKNFEDRREEDIRERNPFVTENIEQYWNDRNFRAWFRHAYINTDNIFAYGSLNGKKEALNHINYYDWYIKNAKYILAYTSGFDEVLKSKNNISKLVKEKKLKTNMNGTLVGFIKE